jgi:steroid delta-isomerase-like uncharacterized protein
VGSAIEKEAATMEAHVSGRAQISQEQARDWVERFFAGWNSHDPDQLLALATEDVVWEDPFIPDGLLRGRAAVREWLSSIWVAMPDLTFELVGDPFISIDGTQIAAAWKGTGKMTGPLEPPGFAPTGGRIEITGIDIHEFDGELVRRVATATDTMGMGRQIGAAPPPGSGGERVGVLMQRLTARRLRRKAR